jgi:hypothetical protein
MIKKVHDDTLKAGKIFGRPRPFTQRVILLAVTRSSFRTGPSNDGWVPPARPGQRRVDVNAAPEGEEAPEHTPAAPKPGAPKVAPPKQ